MADQNWVLQSHIYQNNYTSSVSFTNTTSGYATKSDGTQTLLNYGNAPVFRIHFKIRFETSADLTGGNFRTYGNYNAGNDFVYHWANNNQLGQITAGNWNGCGGQNSYSTSYQEAGYGMTGSEFSNYNWGASTTDIDGNTVASWKDRRTAWSTGWLETHFDNQSAYYPWHWFYGMATDQQNGNFNDTGTQYWGAWCMGAGGCSNGPYIDQINLAADYNFRGDFFLFRGMNSNNQVNE